MGIQLKRMASMANSRPMEGRAILIADPMNGVRKEPATVTMRAIFFEELGFIPMMIKQPLQSIIFYIFRRKQENHAAVEEAI